jgi:hypothetical protein
MRVQIVDPDHPHFPERGTLTGKIIRMKFSGHEMAEMKLDHCPHGGDACFVSKGQVESERKASPSR